MIRSAMRTSVLFLSTVIAAGGLAAGSPEEAVTFTAVTKSESPGGRLSGLGEATVRGWAEGDRGKVEFLESGNRATPKGSILLTNDGAKTIRFFDPAAGTCRPWVAMGAAGLSTGAAPSSATFENVRAEKTLDEPGPEMLGLATRHYRFRIAYDQSAVSAGVRRRSHTERSEEIWAAARLSDPALGMWLTGGVPRTDSEELDRKVAGLMAQVTGAPLRRVTVVRMEFEGRSPQTATTTLVVTSLTRASVPASTFQEPFPCKIRSSEDRR